MNNPQAFPHGDPTHRGEQGMTLRDYFAAKAMQGMLSNSDLYSQDGRFHNGNFEMAYEVADAMLKAREQ